MGKSVLSEVERELTEAYENALLVHHQNKAAGSPGVSLAYDSGICSGIAEAIGIVKKLQEQDGR